MTIKQTFENVEGKKGKKKKRKKERKTSHNLLYTI